MKNCGYLLHMMLLLATMHCLISCGNCCSSVNHEILNIVHYNIGTFNKSEESSITRTADLLQRTGADIISFNELDSCTIRSGNVYQLQDFAQALGDWDFRFGKAIDYDGGVYGVGICSKKKILSCCHIPLPQGDGSEARALLVCEYDNLVFATTHLDYLTEDTQLLQLKCIDDFFREEYGVESNKPIILCADTNAETDSRLIKEMVKNWTIISDIRNSYPAEAPEMCIDYMFLYKMGGRCKILEKSHLADFLAEDADKISDHLPLYVKIEI